jgi:hypothetical protein
MAESRKKMNGFEYFYVIKCTKKIFFLVGVGRWLADDFNQFSPVSA